MTNIFNSVAVTLLLWSPNIVQAQEHSLCPATILTVSGAVPPSARGLHELDEAETSQMSARDRPVMSFTLDEDGYRGEIAQLRFSRSDLHSWIVEWLPRNEGDESAPVPLGWLTFDKDGKQVAHFAAQLDNSKLGRPVGDRLYFAFDDVVEKEDGEVLRVGHVTRVDALCDEAPRIIVGPDELTRREFQITFYSPGEGRAVMIKDSSQRKAEK